MNPLPLVAIVIPVFNEEAVLPELLRRLGAVFSSDTTVQWLAILVNDGSRDGSAALVSAHHSTDCRFALVDLSRNFGFQSALAAGLATAQRRGVAAVVTMDADLQDPPEVIPQLVQAWKEGGEVVRAVRRSRKEYGLRRVGFDFFHRFFGWLSDFPMESDSGTFGLMNAAALNAFDQLSERNRFFPGLRSWVGFRQTTVAYDRQERAAGKPKQTLIRLVRYALDGVFSFSYLPLRLLTYTGGVVAAAGLVFGTFFVTRRLLGIEVAQTGFTTLVTLVLFLGGIQLVGIGVLGEYLGRIYDEVKQRPNFIVRRELGLDE